jgi:hypothetical protein
MNANLPTMTSASHTHSSYSTADIVGIGMRYTARPVTALRTLSSGLARLLLLWQRRQFQVTFLSGFA